MLVCLLLVLPLLEALGLALFKFYAVKKRTADIWAILFNLIIFVLAALLLFDVSNGAKILYQADINQPFRPSLKADQLTAMLVALVTFLWLLVTVYTPGYIRKEKRDMSYRISQALTLTFVLGVLLAGDLLTLLLFFELMTVTSFFLVIHRGDRPAIKASYYFLFFSLAGGLLIALALALLKTATGVIPQIGLRPEVILDHRLFNGAILLLVAGFGLKAGMAPFHLWLPHAHAAAPTPASALLSGLIIKVGIYGLIRTIFWAGSELSGLAGLIIGLGLTTMVVGVGAALLQADAKRLLAYHSVSQMGYVILGLGLSLYLNEAGGLALTGAIAHVVNHALFKAALFLAVGIVYIRTGRTDLYKLGGLWRRLPLAAILLLPAVLGITGVPGLNGYLSKTVLHHSFNLAAADGSPWLVAGEKIFTVVGIGTGASFAKLYYLIFLKKTKEPVQLEQKQRGDALLYLPLALIGAVLVIIGTGPQLFFNGLILPATGGIAPDSSSFLANISFWNGPDLLSAGLTIAAGILVCFLGLKSGAFHWQVPRWLTVEGNFTFLVYFVARWREKIARGYDAGQKRLHEYGRRFNASLLGLMARLDSERSVSLGRFNLVGVSADIAVIVLLLLLLFAGITVLSIIAGLAR